MKRHVLLLCLIFITCAIFFALIMNGLYGESNPNADNTFATNNSTPTTNGTQTGSSGSVQTPVTTPPVSSSAPPAAPNPYLEGMGREFYYSRATFEDREIFVTSISYPVFSFVQNKALEERFNRLSQDILSELKKIAKGYETQYLKDAQNGKEFLTVPHFNADFEINRIENGLLSISFRIIETNSGALVNSYGKHYNFDFEIDNGIMIDHDTLFKNNDPALFYELLCDKITKNSEINTFEGYEKSLPDILTRSWFLTATGLIVEIDGGQIWPYAEPSRKFEFTRQELDAILSEYGKRLLSSERAANAVVS